MSLTKKQAIDLFVDIVKNGDCPDESLTDKHIHRGYVIEQRSDNEFTISIERHPHLFARTSLGQASSAFATVNRIYLLNTNTRKVDYIEEKLVDVEINCSALAEQDFSSEGEDWWIDKNEEDELAKHEKEEDVKSFAINLFNNINWRQIHDTLYISDYDLPPDFREKLKTATKEVFIEKVMDRWRYLKARGD